MTWFAKLAKWATESYNHAKVHSWLTSDNFAYIGKQVNETPVNFNRNVMRNLGLIQLYPYAPHHI